MTVNQTFAQENDDMYEGLGIKIKYFDPWSVLTTSDDANCYTKNFCMLILGIKNGKGMAQIWVTQDKENSPKIKYQCKCTTLKDYVRYFYTNTIFQFYNFSFINDNQTIIPENRSAIQIEYELTLDDIRVHALTIFAKDNDSFYQFTYYTIPSLFSKYLNDFKQMVNSLEFVSTTETKKKQPSFMNDIDDEANNTSKFIEENDDTQDLLDIENDNYQQKQKQLKQQQLQQQQQQLQRLQQQKVYKQQQQQQQQRQMP
jgi:hypothetical protein